jgi:sugar lactone lactonase YvrE
MPTKLEFPVRITVHLFCGAACAGAAMLIASSAQAQNLFVSEGSSIYEITPGGVESTFATGVAYPEGMAFDSAGNLFVTDTGGNIDRFTPLGVESTFATGLNFPLGLAFNSAGILFEADGNGNKIYEFTPSGARSTFAALSGNPEAGLR